LDAVIDWSGRVVIDVEVGCVDKGSSFGLCYFLLSRVYLDTIDNMLTSPLFALGSALFALGNAQVGAGTSGSIGEDQLLRDPGVYGPELEVVHLYFDQFPTGIAVSREGRKFSNYPGALDPNNTYRGEVPKYTIAELFPNNTERAWPSAEINQPPGGAINYTTYPPTGANYPDYLIGSQSIVIDSLDRAWILDTGRVATPNGTLVAASYGGPKLIGVDLSTNTIFKTILFPPTVAYPDSYLNDVRFDLRSDLSGTGGEGIAYITDSSTEGRNGIVMADLCTGESWRHLDGNSAVRPEKQHVEYLWGEVIYAAQPGLPFTYLNFGSDGKFKARSLKRCSRPSTNSASSFYRHRSLRRRRNSILESRCRKIPVLHPD
jgi:hypothetical protein